MTESRRGPVRWGIPLFALTIGVVYLIAGLAAGNVGFGIGGLVVMTALGVGFLVASRYSETVRGLMDRRDERINSLDRDASLFAGALVIGAVLVMFVVEIARGQDGSPYYQLGALGGVGYVAALLWLRLRR